MHEYKQAAREARRYVLDLIYRAQTSHIGSNFSAIDIMAVLFDKVDPEKDDVVLSAGWKAAAWYFFLWKKGVITKEELDSYCQLGSPFIGLVEPMNRWGLRVAGGSMGLGLPAAVGMALAKKLKGEDGYVYVLMSDGELQCGTTWESALIAAKHKLNNLVVIVDYNGLQAMGSTTTILPEHNPFTDLWNGLKVDGHDTATLFFAFDKAHVKRESPNLPLVIIAKTVKGKGVSFMEGDNQWHYRAPNEDEYEKAKAELV